MSPGRTPLLNYDFSRVPLYSLNHSISTVKGLEHEEDFSASRLPQRSGVRNIATREYINIVNEENTASRGMP